MFTERHAMTFLETLKRFLMCRCRRRSTWTALQVICGGGDSQAREAPLRHEESATTAAPVSKLLAKLKLVDSWKRPLLVHSISGDVIHSLDEAGDRTKVEDIVDQVCDTVPVRHDEVRLMAGTTILDNCKSLGDCIEPPGISETLELSLAIILGPSVKAESASGSRIEILDGVPERRSECHFDREYIFTSLGDFETTKGMRFVMTCNEDRKTPSHRVMWRLDVRSPMTVFLNFRSERHVRAGGVLDWLEKDGWALQQGFRSCVSSGYPNGPYAGPVYAKAIEPENRKYIVNLMGSNFWEGTYFVFIQEDA
eukprot:TRINITY_DN29290_c0_g1_i1.p1 TRINITY_DN29290_c0_g1~~TRINITY_DN29290_c0_g1_i1.p1  ORF type:complete len:310 (-),score=54.38 TRINITY_DN29290_c0_g1_i1:147-1076(-)